MLLWSKAIRDNIVLDEVTTSKYLFPQFKIADELSNYGYGWGILNDDLEDKLVHHSGGSDLFASDMWMHPNKGITIIVLSNKSEEYVYSITRKISNFLLKNKNSL